MLLRVAAIVVLSSTLHAQEFASFLTSAAAELRASDAGAVATRAAVLVAADVYRHLPGDGLPSAGTTIEQLRGGLTAHAGFAPAAVDVLRGEAVHQEGVRAAILAAGRKLQPSDDGLLLVGWAGHGWMQGREAPEQHLLTHFSAEQGAAFTAAIAVGQLVSWLGEARVEAGRRGVSLRPVLWIDACRTSRGAPPRKVTPIPREAWQVYGASQGQMVAAGQGGETFRFTGSLLARLPGYADRGGAADLLGIFKVCKEATEAASGKAQVPELVEPRDETLRRGGAPALVVPRRVSLTVRCVDALAGTPVAGALVRFNDDEVTAADGAARRQLAPASVVVAVRAPGYLGRTDEVDLGEVEAGAELTVKLVPQVAVVRGRLVPAATARVVAAGGGEARDRFHVVEATTGPDGRFELRVPALGAGELRVVQHGRVLQSFALPAQPGGLLRDRDGRHDGVPVAELVCALSDSTLAALDAAAPPVPVAGEPRLEDPDDRLDWDQAKRAIEQKRWDLARSRLRRIRGDAERIGALREQVEARWGVAELERLLATGKASGDWSGLDGLRKWWDGKPGVEEAARIEALFAEVERENVPVEVRQGFAAGNQAYADGEFERALASYAGVRAQANAHYGAQIDAQVADIRRRLYRRHASVAFQAELDGELAEALDAYGKALEHSARVKEDVERLLGDPKLAASARGRELARRLGGQVPAGAGAGASGAGSLPAGWACEVLDATPGAKTGYPRRVRDQRSGIVFLLVEPREFRMGSTKGDGDEQPVHTVRITKPFYLAETETTQEQWEAVMGTGSPSHFKGERLPVETVSWDDVQDFLRRLNGGAESSFRLPTEAEWEYACRAGTTTEYAFGDVISTELANYDGNFTWGAGRKGVYRERTVDVGSFKPNAWGFFGMHGNVWEWCSDYYDSDYYASCRDGVSDPQGPASGSSRVLRGGSWGDHPGYLRSANRSGIAPDSRNDYVGCRVARTL
jgi:formylglycine-generating enzyme required for sulfatase activity